MASLSDALVQELLCGRYIASLATLNDDGTIHLTSVWYLLDDRHLFVATSSRTRKLRNLQARPTASLMVDSRDPLASRGVTCSGPVDLLTGSAAQQMNLRIHRRYLSEAALHDPRVAPVFAGFDDVTLKLAPATLFTWDMRELDRAVMGGAMATTGYLLPLDR